LLAGADAAGRMLLFAPNPYQGGASVSHFDTSAFPNLLMEPNISPDLPIGVDATLPLFNDIGWFSTSPSGPPTVNFTFSPSTPVTGQAVQFTDTSTGSPTSWSWNFGDGGTSTVPNPTHTFGTGTYQVSLTASNAGGSNTKTQTVVVSYGGGTVCTSDAYTLCLLGGRYRITSYWENQYAGGAISTLYKTSLTGATGAFWLSDSNTYEYLIRINTATDNGRAWIAIPTFTDVEFWITVEDLTNGQSKIYHSLPGNRTLIYDPYFFVYP
jgi:PKD repeat protein